MLWRAIRKCQKRKYGLEIYTPHIGPRLHIVHAFGITINEQAILGSDCTVHKGITIGQENRGRRKGTPIIGDRVWIGINATVVGKITIGNNVLIAPNSFVNFDVPDNSIVIGCPGQIYENHENATDGYL